MSEFASLRRLVIVFGTIITLLILLDIGLNIARIRLVDKKLKPIQQAIEKAN